MVRVSLAAVSVAFALVAGKPAQAADLHWFYDDQRLHNGSDYRHDDYYREQAYRGTYRPEPDELVYRPRLRHDSRHWRRLDGEGVSCLQGVELLRDYGFRYIDVVDCRNGHYLYEAVLGRAPWRIRMNRTNGELVDAGPLN